MPSQIGRYIILRKLGQGGMGAVYEAEHSKLQKRVALKVLPQEVANDPAAVARFEREMLAVGRVTHPGIVQAHDADEADGIRYLAMEMVDGHDVADVATYYEEKAGKPIPLSVACEIVRQAAVAMQAAHDAGLVHRDLKPSNLMLSVDGTVKVLDLGLAMLDAKHGDGEGLTSTGQVMGTVDYMAPEQAAETRSVDARADVYSLGATLYRLIAGKAPYPSDRFSSMLQKLMALANAQPTPLKELRPKCPDKLVALVESAMAKDPVERTATAADLATALESAGDANKLAELAGKMPKREPIDRAAIEATRTSAIEAVDQAEVTGTMPGPTQPRMTADPSVDTDNTAEATFIAQSIQAGENAPTFIGAADGSATAVTSGSPVKWERKKKPAVPKWALGVGVAVLALLVAIPIFTSGSSSPATPDKKVAGESRSGSRSLSVPATEYLSTEELEDITRSGIAFTERDASVDCGDIDIDISKAFTLEMWCRPDQLPEIEGRSSNVGLSLGPFELKRYSDDNDLSNVWQCGVRKTGDSVQASEASFESFFDKSATADPVLQHVAAQWDGKAMQLFVDGRPLELASTAFSGGVKNPDANRVARKLLSTLSGRDLRIGSAATAYWGQSPETQFYGTIYQARLSENARYSGPFTPKPLTSDAATQALYKLSDESGTTLADLSGNGHDGEIIRAKWLNADEQLSEASPGLEFDGIDDYVKIGSLEFDGSHAITLEATITPRSIEEPTGIVGNLYSGGISIGAMLGTLGVVSVEKERKARALIEQPVVINKRVHIAGTWDGEKLQFFVDGHLVSTSDARRADIDPSGYFFAIGAYPEAKGGFFDGVVHNARISKEVRYTSDFVPPSRFESDPQTLALYNMEERTGTVLRDSSGNNHHGQIIGAEWVQVDTLQATTQLSTTENAPPPAISPFDEAQAKAHQNAWARHLGEPVVTTNSIGMQLAVIPPGEFVMGEPNQPGKTADVTLTKPFRMGVHEVTQGEWKTVMDGDEPWQGQNGVIEGDDVAATFVNWSDAVTFCQRLTERERAAGKLRDGWEYRLPTEAEWEYACRAGTTTAWSFGNAHLVDEYAWFESNAKSVGEAYAHAVGLKKPNPWGLHDVHGNVSEWCSDWHKNPLPGGTDPTGSTEGPSRVLRGGGFGAAAGGIRSAHRPADGPLNRHYNLGFRVVLAPAAGTPITHTDSSVQMKLSEDSPPPAVAPFDAAQAKAHQAEWAGYLGMPVEFTNTLGMRFVLVPPGEFTMGTEMSEFQPEYSNWRDPSFAGMIRDRVQQATPPHRVTLTRPFYIQRGQVNQDHYRRVTGSVPAGNEGEHGFLMRNVALLDAVGFCNELSKLENRTPAYRIEDDRADWDRDSVGYRLPTEAEWEFAARAGTTAPWVFDYRGLTYDEFKDAVQQCMTRHRGAQAKANAFGLIDFYGGSDDRCFDRGRTYTREPVIDPFGNPGQGQGIARGGSWFSEAGWEPSINNSVTRNRIREDNLRFTGLGRVVLSIPFPSPSALEKDTP